MKTKINTLVVIQSDILDKMSRAAVTDEVELVEVTATAPEEQNPLFQNSDKTTQTAKQTAADKEKVLAALARESECLAKFGMILCLVSTGITLIMAAVLVSRAFQNGPSV